VKSVRGLIRNLHLQFGLVLALVVGLYIVSGAAILFIRYLPEDGPSVTTERLTMPTTTAGLQRGALQRAMAEAAGARGRIQPVELLPDGGARLRSQQPGLSVAAELAADGSTLTVTRTRFGIMRTLRTLHTQTGYAGGAPFILWSVLVDLVSLALIGFALSGIYLWFRLVRKRRLGWLVLAGSWGYTLGLIAYLALA